MSKREKWRKTKREKSTTAGKQRGGDKNQRSQTGAWHSLLRRPMASFSEGEESKERVGENGD